MHINNESYKNLPDKYRRQHSDFTIGGEEGSNPVAQLRNPNYADMLVEFGILEDRQLRTIILFSMFRAAALNSVSMRTMRYDEFISDGETKSPSSSHDEMPPPADTYHTILRALTKRHIYLLDMLLKNPPAIKPDQKHAYKDAFYSLYGEIERALMLIDGIIYPKNSS